MSKKILSYEVISKLGVGGMGIVYKARHIITGKIVAIKSLAPIYASDEDIRKRFVNEALILSKLKHPNIVEVYDFIELPDEMHIVMEFVEGKTLTKLIGEEIGPIPYQRALPIFNQILDGISYAHKQGVIHRDIKPSNIIVTPDNKVKITDFGIAKLHDATQHTRTGTRLGTLYYMSPEQIRGEKEIDERSDIYSLGVTLFEMLAGRLPYGKKGELSEFEIMQKIINEPLPDPRDFYPAIPERFVEAIKKATEKDKHNRPKTCYDFLKIINNEDYQIIIKTKNIDYKNFKAIKFLQKIYGHTDSVNSIDFSPDGKWIVSGSEDKTIKLWDVNTGKLIRTLKGHKGSVYSVSFSPDGKWIVSGGDDKTIKLWDVNSGELIRTFKGDNDYVTSVSFSPDGNSIVSDGAEIVNGGWSENFIINLWDVNTGILDQIFEGHDNFINSVSFSPDGRWIVSGSFDTTIKLWDVNSGELIRTFEGHAGGVMCVSFSPDGRWIVSGSDDKTIKLWDVNSGKIIKTFEGHNNWVNSVSFSPDGKWIVSGSNDTTIKLWNVETGELVKTFNEHYSSVYSVEFSPDGKYFVSGGRDGAIILYGEE